jgi:hypothetical protein
VTGYERALTEVANRLGATRHDRETKVEFGLRVRRLARRRDRKLARRLNQEFSAYLDRMQEPSNLV